VQRAHQRSRRDPRGRGEEHHHEQPEEGRGEPAGVGRIGAKREHEAQEVERQRHDPEQRHRRDVGGDGHRGPQREQRRRERQRHPTDHIAQRRRGFGDVNVGRGVAGGARAEGQQHTERDPPRGPQQALGAQREQGLQHEGIEREGGEAPEVARGVEGVGVLVARGEPALEQRRAHREEHQRRAEGAQEVQQQPPRGVAVHGRGRSSLEVGREGEHAERAEHHVEVRVTPQPEALRERVREGVPEEQDALKEELRGGPHRGRAAHAGEQRAGHHGLDHEEQRRRGEARGDEARATVRGDHQRWYAGWPSRTATKVPLHVAVTLPPASSVASTRTLSPSVEAPAR
jgi:hypothetical protein